VTIPSQAPNVIDLPYLEVVYPPNTLILNIRMVSKIRPLVLTLLSLLVIVSLYVGITGKITSLYIYQIVTPDGKEKISKLAIIR